MTKKAVLISIRPKWCELIVNGKKTVEVRKTRPILEPPFKCYVYCTQPKRPYDDFISFVAEDGEVGFFGGGKVICEFVCDAIFPILVEYSDPESRLALRESPFTCLTDKQIMDYLGNGKEGCAWHISDLKIYDTQKKLSEFSGLRQTKFGLEPVSLKRPPQSWCYVESEEK